MGRIKSPAVFFLNKKKQVALERRLTTIRALGYLWPSSDCGERCFGAQLPFMALIAIRLGQSHLARAAAQGVLAQHH